MITSFKTYQQILEASYQGNMGMVEMFQFYQQANQKQIQKLNKIIMNNIKTYDQFVNESKNAYGHKTKKFLENYFEDVYLSVLDDDDEISFYKKKKKSIKSGDIILYSYTQESWNNVIEKLKDLSIKYTESNHKDDSGESVIIFSPNQ